VDKVKVYFKSVRMRIRGGASATVTEQEVPPPVEKRKKRKVKKKTISSFSIFLILFFLYAIPPLLIRYSGWVKDAIIFVHHVREPFFSNLSDPESFGLKAVREVELFHPDDCSIKVWQMLPKQYHEASPYRGSSDEFDKALSDGVPVVLYLHGNTGTRATTHRVNLYKYLAGSLGHHVIAFDYRGFGDSKCYPSEENMMEDALLVWSWLKTLAPRGRVYVWGHSLGSAAATHMAQVLSNRGESPSGLILDAPFTNLVEAGRNHPLSLPYWPVMPLFSLLTFESFKERFPSDEQILEVTCPILIMHGHKDRVIPYHLGRKLYEKALEGRKSKKEEDAGTLEFLDCQDSGHKYNWEFAKERLRTFIDSN